MKWSSFGFDLVQATRHGAGRRLWMAAWGYDAPSVVFSTYREDVELGGWLSLTGSGASRVSW